MTILVAAAIIKKNSKYLIARRSPEKHLGGFWEFPGGKIESGETAEECLVREIQEELNVTIKIISFLDESLFHYSDKSVLLKGFISVITAGEIVLVDHDDYKWVTVDEMKNYKIAPADLPFIEKLNSENG